MIINMRQVDRDIFSASFEFLRDRYIVGSASLRGQVGSIEAEVDGNIGDHEFFMQRSPSTRGWHPAAFRPYSVFMDDTNMGEIFQDTIRESFFSSYHVFRLEGETGLFTLYPLSFGEDGYRDPLFKGDTQIAQIDKSAIIRKGLNNYTFFVIDEYAAKIATIFAIYLYTCISYKAGVKARPDVAKYYTATTTNKALLSKYDPGFKDRLPL